MKPRLFLAGCLIRIDRFLMGCASRLSGMVGTWLLIFLRPNELEEHVRWFYNQPKSVELWGGPESQALGLTGDELYFVTKYLKEKGRCLVLQCGGGRESIALTKIGFQVTGLDTSQALVETAKGYATSLSLDCCFEAKDMFEGPSPSERYHALFLTRMMYSAIPTRQRRIAFLKKAVSFLSDDGFAYLEFFPAPGRRQNAWKFRVKRALARLVAGNRGLEKGDIFRMEDHFWHLFQDPSELSVELEEAGFDVAEMNFDHTNVIATLKRSQGTGPRFF